MRIYSKVASGLFALVVALPLAFGQNATSEPAPSQSSTTTDGQVARHPMHRQMDRRLGGAWQRSNWRGMHRHHRGQRQFMLAHLVSNPTFRERIGITPQQALKIRTQTLNFRKAQIQNRADLKVKHLELKNLLSSDNPDRSAIDGKLQEISAVRLAREKSAIDFHLDMRAALTPDQRQKLQQMREDFFRHRGFGHQGPQGPRGDMRLPDARG